MSFVYAIGLENSPIIKVGKANSVEKRFSAIQTGCPYKLKIWNSIEVENSSISESFCHTLFYPYHIRGEWFNVSPNKWALCMVFLR